MQAWNLGTCRVKSLARAGLEGGLLVALEAAQTDLDAGLDVLDQRVGCIGINSADVALLRRGRGRLFCGVAFGRLDWMVANIIDVAVH